MHQPFDYSDTSSYDIPRTTGLYGTEYDYATAVPVTHQVCASSTMMWSGESSACSEVDGVEVDETFAKYDQLYNKQVQAEATWADMMRMSDPVSLAGSVPPFYPGDMWASQDYRKIDDFPSYMANYMERAPEYPWNEDYYGWGQYSMDWYREMAMPPTAWTEACRELYASMGNYTSGLGSVPRTTEDDRMAFKFWASIAEKGLSQLDHLMSQNQPTTHESIQMGDLSALQREWQQKNITTVMLRNIPNKYTQQMLMDELSEVGFCNTWDFLYLPVDSDKNANLGYAFMNFIHPELAARFKEVFEGSRMKRFNSKKVVCVTPATLQGYAANYHHFEAKRVTKAENPTHRPMFLKGKPVDEKKGIRLARREKKPVPQEREWSGSESTHLIMDTPESTLSF